MEQANPAAELVASYVEEVWHQGNLPLVRELLAPDHIRRDLSLPMVA